MNDLSLGTLPHVAPDRTPVLTPATVAQLARPYPYAVRQALALAAQLRHGKLEIFMPDGAILRVEGEGGPFATMIVRDYAFATKLAKGGDVGVAEAFLDGDWDTPNLERFLELFCANQQVMAQLMAGKPILRFAQMLRHWLNRNTKAGSRRNIHAHYDLGNAFYSAWLDPTMTYSSALYPDGETDLAAAQTAKYRALADALHLRPGMRVLEIGCGWGGFAEIAARDYGCHVTGLTISREQYDFAKQRAHDAGLSARIDIRLQDYRDETGRYDAIASIEMFEAVGEEYWKTYFRQLRDRLVPGGRAGLQVITIDEKLFPNYRRELDFIRRYVFPGGMLPTPTHLRDLGRAHGLAPVAERAFGGDYATTLVEWRTRFRAAWPRLTSLGFDERFRRLWEYYLAYCEAGFRVGTIDVKQVVYVRG